MLSSMGGQVNESRGVVAATKRLLLKHRNITQNPRAGPPVAVVGDNACGC